MPTYEYKCEKCGHTLEEYQSIKDKPLRKCPKCGKNSLKRLMGMGAALIFKGSGFYITDYRKSGGRAASDTSAKPDKSESTTGKSDSSSALKDSKDSSKDSGKAAGKD